MKTMLLLSMVFLAHVGLAQQKEPEKSDSSSVPKNSPTAPAAPPDGSSNELDSSYFYIRAYSDFVGLQDDQPNGLLQTEFFFDWNLRLNYDSAKALVFFYNLVLPEVGILKLDEKERYLPVLYGETTNRTMLNATDLVKYANLRLAAKLNILKLKLNSLNRLYLDGYAVHYRTGITDSTRKEPESIFNTFGAGGNILFRSYKKNTKFRLDLMYSLFWLKSTSNRYDLVSSSADAESTVMTDDQVSNDTSPLSNLSIQVAFEGKTHSFLRFSYTNNWFTFGKSPDFYNGFWQVQIGVSKRITLSTIGSGKPKKT